MAKTFWISNSLSCGLRTLIFFERRNIESRDQVFSTWFQNKWDKVICLPLNSTDSPEKIFLPIRRRAHCRSRRKVFRLFWAGDEKVPRVPDWWGDVYDGVAWTKGLEIRYKFPKGIHPQKYRADSNAHRRGRWWDYPPLILKFFRRRFHSAYFEVRPRWRVWQDAAPQTKWWIYRCRDQSLKPIPCFCPKVEEWDKSGKAVSSLPYSHLLM